MMLTHPDTIRHSRTPFHRIDDIAQNATSATEKSRKHHQPYHNDYWTTVQSRYPDRDIQTYRGLEADCASEPYRVSETYSLRTAVRPDALYSGFQQQSRIFATT